MATTEENMEFYNADRVWGQKGDDWSESWGGVDMQWHFTVLPRIHAFIPRETILEIAPGFGRWTQFLASYCRKLIIVDLSEKCIRHCRDRFAHYSHIEYHTNDGSSLDMIPDESVDFVFSFDSLVHVEEDVIQKYLQAISKKIKKNGAAFLHHSNLGEYKLFFGFNNFIYNKIPHRKIKKILSKKGILEHGDGGRAYSMTAAKFKRFAEDCGLSCRQEIINWGTTRLIDCFSTIKRSENPTITQSFRNVKFTDEINYIRSLSKLYGEKIID